MKVTIGATPKRFFLVLVLFAFLYGVIITRLFYWQVVKAQDMRDISVAQSSESLRVGATRGEIMTADSFPLATNKISYLLYANPKVIEDQNLYVEKLSPILSQDTASISAKLARNLFWVKIANKLSEKTKEVIEKLNLPGLGFQEEADRYYPEASMAAQLVGFLGKDQNAQDHGYFGLEGFYNSQLSGREGKLYVVKDALGHPVINDIREEKKIDGRNITLTLDRRIQFLAENRLLEGVRRYNAEGGSVLIMNPNTGEVLASASYPRFDPTTYYEFSQNTYTDPVISSLYEPGSTFKVLVMAAAIDKHLIGPDTRCLVCSGPISISGYSIKTWNDKYNPNETMTEVIQHSDNIGMVFVGQKLGMKNFVEYIKNFGFGAPTEIDLQGEATGIVRDKEDWREIDVATASFGQGISVTPIQLLTAVSSIANGGSLMRPYLVNKITTEDGKTIEISPQKVRTVLAPSTTKMMTWMMVNAVEKGEAQWTRLKDYRIAGKTGTAQVPVAGHYDPNETIASFIGFFPAENPKVSMLVLVNKPKTSIYGADTAAPIFFNIARDILTLYNIPPNY